MRIITSGPRYLDIDAYACMIAYADLLNLQGTVATAYSSATLNESITPTIRSWPVNFTNLYTPNLNDTFTIVDVSEPQYLDPIVDIDRVDEVIDHHMGFKDFWIEKGVTTTLDFIGAAATLVYEEWVKAGRLDAMSQTSARLLLSAILDNTLNFQADITNARDHAAYDALLPCANLPESWTKQYFSECQQQIVNDLGTALINDTKMQAFKNLDNDEIAIGQLVVWDAKNIIDSRLDGLTNMLSQKHAKWFINIVCISDKSSYFVTDNKGIQQWAEKLFDVSFDGIIAKANHLWLRKEIVRADLEYSKAI